MVPPAGIPYQWPVPIWYLRGLDHGSGSTTDRVYWYIQRFQRYLQGPSDEQPRYLEQVLLNGSSLQQVSEAGICIWYLHQVLRDGPSGGMYLSDVRACHAAE
jgi:hypothetical protein